MLGIRCLCVKSQKNGLINSYCISGRQLASVKRVADAVGIEQVFGAWYVREDKLAQFNSWHTEGKNSVDGGVTVEWTPLYWQVRIAFRLQMGQDAVTVSPQAQSDFVVMNGQLAMCLLFNRD